MIELASIVCCEYLSTDGDSVFGDEQHSLVSVRRIHVFRSVEIFDKTIVNIQISIFRIEISKKQMLNSLRKFKATFNVRIPCVVWRVKSVTANLRRLSALEDILFIFIGL